MGLACLFSTPNPPPPFLSAQNAVVIFPLGIDPDGRKGTREGEQETTKKKSEEEAFGNCNSGKPV